MKEKERSQKATKWSNCAARPGSQYSTGIAMSGEILLQNVLCAREGYTKGEKAPELKLLDR